MIIQGWTDYDRAGLQEPDEVTEATWNYRQDSDAYARFVSEQCYKAPPLQVKASKVWERWQRWSKTEGVDESSQKVLGQALERMGFEPARTKTGRFWKGLDLVEEEPEEPPYGSSQGWRRQKVTRMTRVPVTSIEPFLWRYTDVTSLASPVTKTPSVDRSWTERLDRSVAEMTERVLRELSDYEKQLQNPDLTPVERRRYERWRRQLLHETGMGDWTTWGTTASGPEVEQCSEVGPTPNGDYSAKKSNPDTNHHQTTPGSSAPEAGT